MDVIDFGEVVVDGRDGHVNLHLHHAGCSPGTLTVSIVDHSQLK